MHCLTISYMQHFFPPSVFGQILKGSAGACWGFLEPVETCWSLFGPSEACWSLFGYVRTIQFFPSYIFDQNLGFDVFCWGFLVPVVACWICLGIFGFLEPF